MNNLTNTTWTFNEWGEVPVTGSQNVTYNISFTSNGNSYSGFVIQKLSAETGANIYYDGLHPVQACYTGVFEEEYKTINIINGQDVTNADLISLLTNNFNLISLDTVITAVLTEKTLSWNTVINADYYNVYRDNTVVASNLTATSYSLARIASGNIRVKGFCNEPAASTNFSNTIVWERASEQNVLLHPYVEGLPDEGVALYPKTKYENIIDLVQHISNQVIENSELLVTSGAVYTAVTEAAESSREIVNISITKTNTQTYPDFARIKEIIDDQKLPVLNAISGERFTLCFYYTNIAVFVYEDIYVDKTHTEVITINLNGTKSRNSINNENQANKAASITSDNDTSTTNYPSNKAVVDYVEAGFVAKETGKGLSTNDYTTAEKNKLAGIQAGAEVNVNADWNAVSGDAEILNKPTIPTKTSELQNDSDFATEDFVNSSVATNTAYYLGSYNLVSDLGFTVPTPRSDVADYLPTYLSGLTVPITPTNNDYLFVQVPTATSTPTVIDHIDRYKYNAQYQEWIYEYTLNNSSFTQAQWDAINSGITSGDVSAFEAHIQNTTIHVTQQDKETWGGKQNAITNNNMLSSDLVDDTNKYHKFVTNDMYDYLEGILYQAPAISVFQLYYNGSAVATTLENGSSVTVNQIRHQETNIANISSLTFNGQAITPSATATIVNLTTPITVSATTTYTMSGVNTRNASFTKGATITVNTYAYSSLTSSTTAPTTGLTRQSVDSTFRSNGASFNYVTGDYLYLYTTYSGATKIQTNVLGQWADVNTTVVGNVTITKSNGVTQTYKCLRTTSAFSASGTATYRVV